MILQQLKFEYKSNEEALIGQPVNDSHFNTLIEESSYVKLAKHKPIVYLNLDDPRFDELLPFLESINYPSSTRKTLGATNRSMLFGAVPAKINRSNFCTTGAVLEHSADLHRLLSLKYSTVADGLMKRYLTQWNKIGHSIFNHSNINKDWQLGDSFWTSGIINHNSPHNFHRDNSNSRCAYSAMITFKGNVSGGYLVLPEYNIAFKVANRSMIFFCGKELIHGVSPINYGTNGHRYSIVYYTTEDLKKCGSYQNEILKATQF
jgi:hypothetical protein